MSVRIAIPTPTSGDEAYNRLNWPAYAEAVAACGATPVPFRLDLSASEAAGLAATCDGVVLPGSPADVRPSRYGQERDEASAPDDPAREAMDRLLLEGAYLDQTPVLAICFGLQFLNVWRGGTLIQDVSVMPVNHSAGRSVAVAHTASVAEGSLLEGLVDREEATIQPSGELRLPVNSSHHQAVGMVGSGLSISSRCPQDGVVESIEGVNLPDSPAHFVLGLQWHPERTFASSATSRAIFGRFVREASSTSLRRATVDETG